MHFTVNRKDMAEAMSRIAPIVDRKASVAILSNVLIETDDQTIRLRSSNLDMEAVVMLDGRVRERGVTSVPAGMLLDIVGATEGDDVSFALTTAPHRATVKCGRAKFNLPVIAPDAFPTAMGGEFPIAFEIETLPFGDALSRTVFAVATDVSRWAWAGVRLQSVDGAISMTATDQKSVATIKITAQADPFAVTIPTRAVHDFIRLMGGHDKATVRISDAAASLTCGNAAITTKLIDGVFPAISLSLNDPFAVIFDRAEMTAALRRVQIAADLSDPGVRLAIGESSIRAITRRGMFGINVEGEDEIQCDATTPAEFGVSIKRTLDILKHLKGDIVELSYAPDAPLLIWRAPCDPNTVFNSGKMVVA